MFPNKRLLTVVSAAALGVAANGALANTAVDGRSAQRSPVAIAAMDPASGLVLDLLGRVEGRVTAAGVEKALREMFAPLNREQANALPALMRGIHGMGWRKDVEAAAAETIGDLIVSSPELSSDPDFQLSIASAVGASAGGFTPVRVAQAGSTDDRLCIYRPTDPRYRLDPNCPPLTTGRVDPGPPTTTGTIGGYP